MIAVLLRYWRPIAAGAGLILLVLLYRMQINSAVERGRAECEAAEAIARQQWRDTYDQRRAEEQAADEAGRDSYTRAAQPIRERIIVQSADPAACRHSDDVVRMLNEQRAAATRQFTAPTGGAVQAAPGRAGDNPGGRSGEPVD